MAATLWRNAIVATLAEPAGWGLVERGALLVEEGLVRWVGEERALPAEASGAAAEHDLGGACVTPGLIDCHTHLVYAGNRAAELELRARGATYEEIARSGGGIGSTVAATRAASDDELARLAEARLRTLAVEGVTTVEVKSGYGLSLADERRCLRVARGLEATGLATVRTTYLGAHAVPPEFEGRADDYVEAVCAWLPVLHGEGLVDAVDVFCEGIAFSPRQTSRVLAAARALGLPVRLHADQLSDQGGARLAAEHGALSADHLEHASEEGAAAMGRSGTVAVLLPAAFLFLRESARPPVDAFRAHGVPIALATDHNPGSAPALSLLLVLGLGCALFGLTPEEALRGVTVNAARALGLGASHGVLAPNRVADLAVWDVEHPRELAYWMGRNPCLRVVRGGVERAAS